MTNKINGIDLSKYFKNHYDSWGRLYCVEYKGNPLELQNDIKRLQEENNILKQAIKNKNFVAIVEENEGLKSLNDFNVQKIEVLQEENEELKAENEQLKKPCLIMPKVKQLAVPIEKYEKLYKALEEIRKKITPICAYCNNIDGFTILDDCENVCEKGVIKYLKIINEVLND